MPREKIKLDYRLVELDMRLIERILVSSRHMKELDKTIRKQVRQNKAEHATGLEIAGRYTVR